MILEVRSTMMLERSFLIGNCDILYGVHLPCHIAIEVIYTCLSTAVLSGRSTAANVHMYTPYSVGMSRVLRSKE